MAYIKFQYKHSVKTMYLMLFFQYYTKNENQFCQKLSMSKKNPVIPKSLFFPDAYEITESDQLYLFNALTKFPFPSEKVLKFKIEELFRLFIVYTNIKYKKRKHTSHKCKIVTNQTYKAGFKENIRYLSQFSFTWVK